MTKIVAIIASSAGEAHSHLAAEALKRTAESLGHDLKTEEQPGGVTLDRADIEAADLVIVGADRPVDRDRFAGRPVYAVSSSEAIRNTRLVVENALTLLQTAPTQVKTTPQPKDSRPEKGPASGGGSKFLVGITSCPTGIAHTFMAAEALKQGAAKLGYDIKVETQGSVGAKNQLTEADIARADAVIIAADTHVDLARFGGKPLYETSTKAAMKNAPEEIETALQTQPAGGESYADQVKRSKAERSEQRTGPYKHLLTGVSYMLPVIVAGGLIIALSFVFGINPPEGSFGAALGQIGGGAAFALIVPVLSGYIAFSIADRPGLAPGLVGGMLAANLSMGFIGGIVSGFLAGYIAKFVRDKVNLPQNFEGLKPVLVIPLLSTLLVGLLLVYVFGGPVRYIMDGLTAFLEGMGSTNAVVLGLILGGMMAIDMGGPVNKAAYTFAVGLLSSSIYGPMAAVMAAGMTPPLGLAIATFVAKKRFNQAEQEAGKVASVLGISFITEGAIPFAANDPFRVIPACIAGSAVAGGLSMLFNCTLRAPHGGIFVLAIPNAVENVGLYIVAIATGTLVTTLTVMQLKRISSLGPDRNKEAQSEAPAESAA
ncbi:PTS fructose transporter subunit EIIBC [filamentous cyanobacterium CCP5]|nr:PTS fructose transporter subunit EIIBC [filamentous cyanobacterium CCP5]